MSARKVSILALLLALSVIGASIKIPAFVGSIALDVFPALLAAVFIGRKLGAFVAGVGHLLSALIAGMPLGPTHLLIALEMMLIVWVFALIYERGKKKLAGLIFIFSNSLLAPLPMILLFDVWFYVAILPSLFIGSMFNLFISLLIIPRFKTMNHKRTWNLLR